MKTIDRSPLRVLFITRAYSPSAAGMERLSWEMINEMRSHPRVEAAVLANETAGSTSLFFSRLRSMGFAVTVIPSALRAARRADVVHIGDPVLSVVGWLIKKIRKKPVAVTVHGLDVAYACVLYDLYLRLFFDELDLYLPISTYVKGLLKKRNVQGNVTVINPGVYDRFYNPNISRGGLARLLPLNEGRLDKVVVLFTSGRLVKRKGHAWFIQHVLPQLPDNVLYVIAGDGPQRDAIRHSARIANVSDRVIMLGRVSDEQLQVLYNTVDAFIQPNICADGDVEGFGLVLPEAALCERVIFAANLEGIPDAVRNGKNGILLESANAQAWIESVGLYAMLPPEKRRDRFNAREYTLQTFSWSNVREKYLRAFQELT